MASKNEFNIIGLVTLIISVLILGLVIPQVINERQENNEDVISLSENAQREVVPDKVRLTFAVVSENIDLSTAINENTNINNKIVDAYKGNSDYTIESKSYRVYPKTKWNKETEEYEEVGYQVYNTIEITTLKLNLAGEIISDVINLGANRIENFEYTLTQEATRRIQNELIEEAYDNAEQRAKVVASVMNKKIVGVKSLEPSSYYAPVYYNRMYDSVDLAKASGSVEESVALSPESQTVTMSVNVVFEIE